MQAFEYKVVPAPHKGTKAKGVKTPEDRVAYSIENILNQRAAEGWEYQRAELRPSEERSGLTGSTTNWRNVLIFRRQMSPAPVQAAPFQNTAPAEPPLTAQALSDVETHSPAPDMTAEVQAQEEATGAQQLPEAPMADDNSRPPHRHIPVSDSRDEQ